jgi:hypothetical protein
MSERNQKGVSVMFSMAVKPLHEVLNNYCPALKLRINLDSKQSEQHICFQ